jgi:lipopolysaccharide export LptBFGC system permease protein LptF
MLSDEELQELLRKQKIKNNIVNTVILIFIFFLFSIFTHFLFINVNISASSILITNLLLTAVTGYLLFRKNSSKVL